MVDDGNDSVTETGEDAGGFVFGEERADDGSEGSFLAEHDTGGIVAAALLAVALVMLAYAAQPFVTGAIAGLLGVGSTGDAGDATLTGGTPVIATADGTRTVRTAPDDTNATPDSTARTSTATRTATASNEGNGSTGGGAASRENGSGDGSGNGTGGASERSPAIDTFSVTDRSADGAATFDIGWNVSDVDRNLVDVQVSLVADPDGEARTVERLSFDAGGARTTGNTTFDVSGGGGEVYEVGIEVVDGAGNTAFELRREVADGSVDG